MSEGDSANSCTYSKTKQVNLCCDTVLYSVVCATVVNFWSVTEIYERTDERTWRN